MDFAKTPGEIPIMKAFNSLELVFHLILNRPGKSSDAVLSPFGCLHINQVSFKARIMPPGGGRIP